MNKILKSLSLTLFLGALSNAQAQRFELVPLIGNIFQSTYHGYEGRIEFNNGVAYGGMLNYLPNERIEIGLNFINQQTTAEFVDYYSLTQEYTEVGAGVAYYQLSLCRNFTDWEKVIPFFGTDLGAVQFYERNENTQDYWRFGFGIKGGVKIQFNERINLRIQPQLEMPIQSFGLGIGIGTGGASVGATGWAGMVQFGIMGGLGITIFEQTAQ